MYFSMDRKRILKQSLIVYKWNYSRYRYFSLRHTTGCRNGQHASQPFPRPRLNEWEAVIGLEIHAKLQTNSKLFSGSGVKFAAPINNQVSFFDAALPGTLPILNKECVVAGVLTALALNCEINLVSKFDRKHYFYADLPAGYQITQQRQPLAKNGCLSFIVHHPSMGVSHPVKRKARIIQLQLEQDSGKSLHDEEDSLSLIDLNRAGVGLMEIITEPDFRSGEEAAAFVKELQMILETLGTCDGIMAEGSMRTDASISLRKPGGPLGIRREVKNINSIRNIVKAVNYEIYEQSHILDEGGFIDNETRAFDHETGETVAMRDKEKVHDYRFMPEPNLPPLRLYTDKDDIQDKSQVVNVDDIRRAMPVLPQQKRQALIDDYGVNMEQALVLVNEPGMVDIFKYLVDKVPASQRIAYNFLKNDVLEIYNKVDCDFVTSPVKVSDLSELNTMLYEGKISLITAKKVLSELIHNPGLSARGLVEKQKLEQIVDNVVLNDIIENVLANNLKALKSVGMKDKKKRKKIINSLMGQIMKQTEGRAEPKRTVQLLEASIISKCGEKI